MSRHAKGALALLLALLLWVGTFPTAQASSNKVLGRMPDWSLTDSNGRPIQAKALQGKVLILAFWASWCPPCRDEIPGFIALQKQYGSRGLQVVGFSMDRSPEVHTRFVRDQKFNDPSMDLDNPAGQKVQATFEKVVGPIRSIPTTLVVDRKGNIVFRHTGFAPKKTFEDVVVPLLGE